MSHQVVQVKRDTVAPCITCPICSKLFREATTIIECLHTFCRKCIYKKLADEEMESCPVCNIDLGCVPLEKLRPDHNLQDLRSKIFPSKRVKVKTPEHEVANPSVTLPTKRKERSLSQLVVNTPRVAAQNGMTGRRSKSSARKASRGSSFTIEKPVKREDDSAEEHPDMPSSPETLTKFTQTLRQDSAASDPTGNLSPEEGKENGSERWEGKVDLWKPLNCLVEAANRSKSSKFTIQGSVLKSESLASRDSNGLNTSKSRNKDLLRQKSKVQDERNNNDHITPPDSERPKNSRRVRQKKARNFGEFRVSPQDVIDASSSKYDRKNHPIWFSLVASDEQEGDSPPLPQITSSYLRIKDGSIPVSFVQKYLKIKLDLTSEDEVEIKCMGQTVIPTLSLHNLVDLWLQTTTTERVSTRIGSSAKDFVMTLGYARRSTVHEP